MGVLVTEYMYPIWARRLGLPTAWFTASVLLLSNILAFVYVYINCCLSKRVGGGGSLQPQRHIPLPLKSQMKMDNLNAKEM